MYDKVYREKGCQWCGKELATEDLFIGDIQQFDRDINDYELIIEFRVCSRKCLLHLIRNNLK